ncbi:MAG TPA: 5-methyltetrahydropteroyltriglutamate--homocysteine S-methyltransferase [Stellaceae bacterium]
MPPFRADHVGSFLRPPALIEARTQFHAGAIDAAALRAAEDAAIRDIVRFQENLGLQSITDGEFRRTYFHIDFLERLDGVEMRGGLAKMQFRTATGTVEQLPPTLWVTGKVRHRHGIEVENFAFLKSVMTQGVGKQTIPSPTMLHFRGGRGAIDQTAYPDLDQFYDEVAAAYRAEIAQLSAAGCTYLQLDDTNLAYLCDVKMRDAARARGEDPNALPQLYARWINAALAERPAGMTVGIHLCRGNFRSAWAAEGGYDPVAEVLFNELAVDAYFLEYDDARSGGFEPLRFLPKGKVAVLGLVSSKVDTLESPDAIKRRIEEAARYAPLDQLCLSPQCGFSSTVHGNDIDRDAPARKLRLVQEVAREVWGNA